MRMPAHFADSLTEKKSVTARAGAEGATFHGQRDDGMARVLAIAFSRDQSGAFEVTQGAADPRLVDMRTPGNLIHGDALRSIQEIHQAQIRIAEPDPRLDRLRRQAGDDLGDPDDSDGGEIFEGLGDRIALGVGNSQASVFLHRRGANLVVKAMMC